MYLKYKKIKKFILSKTDFALLKIIFFPIIKILLVSTGYFSFLAPQITNSIHFAPKKYNEVEAFFLLKEVRGLIMD